MNIIFLLLLLQININFIYSEDDKPTEKEIAQAERRVKSLACSILSNTHYAYSNHTKRQIRELLKKNNIIQRAAESHDKIFEFLRAICYRRIDEEIASRIVDELSQKRYEILEDEDYAKLFKIEPNLNFTKIEKTIKRVNKIMKKLEKEEAKTKKNETSKEQEEPNIYKIFGFKSISGLLITLIIISISSYFSRKKNENENIIEEKENENKENNDKDKNEKKDDKDEKNKEEKNKEQNKEKERENNDSIKEKKNSINNDNK